MEKDKGSISCVYKITNPIGQVYVGQTTDLSKRYYAHKHNVNKHNNRICDSFKTYGFDNHKFKIIEECDINELKNRERYWQDFYKCCGDNGLNSILTKTDILDSYYIDMFKNKMSEAIRSVNKSKRTIIGIEYCKIMRLRVFKPIRRVLPDKYKLVKMNLVKPVAIYKERKKLSYESINRLKTMNIGRSSKKKGITSGRKGLKNKYSDKRNGRLVFDLYSGIYYHSVTEASFAVGLNRSTLQMYLSGKRLNKTNLMFV